MEKTYQIDNKKHQVGISVAKAVCIILMVIGHSKCPDYVWKFIYLFHMPCFFIISGILFKMAYIDTPVSVFIKKKIKSLYKPFVTYAILFIVLHNLFFYAGWVVDLWSLRDILFKSIQSLIFLPVVTLQGGMWFVERLFFASIFVLVVIKFVKLRCLKLETCYGKAAIFLSVLSIIVASVERSFDISVPYFGQLTMQASAYILAGIAIKQYHFYRSYGILYGGGILILVFLLSLIYSTKMETSDGIDIILLYCISIPSSLAILSLSKENTFATRIFDYIGKHTMDILAFHFLAFKMVDSIWGVFNPNLEECPWYIAVVFSIVISMLLGYILRRMKIV